MRFEFVLYRVLANLHSVSVRCLIKSNYCLIYASIYSPFVAYLKSFLKEYFAPKSEDFFLFSGQYHCLHCRLILVVYCSFTCCLLFVWDYVFDRILYYSFWWLGKFLLSYTGCLYVIPVIQWLRLSSLYIYPFGLISFTLGWKYMLSDWNLI